MATFTVMLLRRPAGFGETVQVDSAGAPAQIRATELLNTPVSPKLKAYVAVCPGAAVAEGDEPEAVARVKSSPHPVRLTLWTLPVWLLLLSTTVSDPLKRPPARGAKATLAAHDPPGGTPPAQLLVSVKLLLAVMLLTIRAAFPLLRNVTACGLLVDFTKTEGNWTCARMDEIRGAGVGGGGAGAVPVPVPAKLTDCVLPRTPPELSIKVSVAVFRPSTVGEKVTPRVQEAPAATLERHLVLARELVN